MAKRSRATKSKAARATRGKKSTQQARTAKRRAVSGKKGNDRTRYSKQETQRRKRFNKLVGKFWSSPEVRARFRANPKAVLEEFGLQVPAGLNVVVVEDTKDTLHIVIPDPESLPETNIYEWPPDDCRGLTIGKTIY